MIYRDENNKENRLKIKINTLQNKILIPGLDFHSVCLLTIVTIVFKNNLANQ